VHRNAILIAAVLAALALGGFLVTTSMTGAPIGAGAHGEMAASPSGAVASPFTPSPPASSGDVTPSSAVAASAGPGLRRANSESARAAAREGSGASVARAWRRIDGAGRRVALTFDDGAAGPWRRILRTLKAWGARATFFVLGPYVSANPELARRTLTEGHAVGSHGWSHAVMTGLTAAQVRRELERSSVPWWTAAHATPAPYLRPPYGRYDRRTRRVAGALGFTRLVLWDVDPEDWRSPRAAVIARRVLRNVRPGSIVLLHIKRRTASALPAILRGLRARDLRPVSLPELFRAAGYR
jgi:peptidoglycan/xylan/chitin deacetylase (PgdA/CDA1 family)